MNGPSLHLTWDELACHDAIRTPYPLDWRGARVALLAREFEAVRAALAVRVGRDVPLRVHSAYRTWDYNRRIHGSPNSQHVQGRALDISPVEAGLLDDLFAVTLDRAKAVLAIRGIGRYDTFVHFDTRPSPHLALWDERSHR